MNIAIAGISSEQARKIIETGGNIVVDLKAGKATITDKGNHWTTKLDKSAEPVWKFDAEVKPEKE